MAKPEDLSARPARRRPRNGGLRLLVSLALGGWLCPSLPAGAAEPEWARLEALLARVEAGETGEAGEAAGPAVSDDRAGRPVPPRAGVDARAGAHELGAAARALEVQARRHRSQFDRAAALDLPPKARERLAAAREAYEEGQGRLLQVLRKLGSGPANDSSQAMAREARDIVNRLIRASRRPPLSNEVGAPRVRAPHLRPKPLPAGQALAQGRRGAAAFAAAPAAGPPPLEALQGTGGSSSPEAIPAPIKTLAAGLAGPVDVYAWVRNSIKPEFYDGVMKGALQTLLEGSGNDADTAALLVALFRAKGIPARFVPGTVEVATPRLRAVTGTTSAEQAVRVLERAGIAHEPVLGPGGITSVKMARLWAEAYVPYANYRGTPVDAQGKVWVPLDAGFKDLAPPRGFDALQALGLGVPALMDEYLAGPQAQTPREFIKAQVTNGLLAQGKTYEDARNDRSHGLESLGILPNTLPYAVVARGEVEYALPQSLHHALRIKATREGATLLDVALDVPDVLGGRLTLAYAPFDEEDDLVVKQFGGLAHTPPYLIDLRVILRRGGIAVAGGDLPVGAGVVFDLALEVSHPGGTETVTNRMTAGNLTAIGLGGREVTGSEPDQSRAAQVLSRIAWSYLDRWNKSDAELADLFRVVPVRPTVSLCLVLSAIQVEYAGGDPLYPLSFDWKGVAIDADLRATSPVGVEGPESEARFTTYSGLEGSILENAVLESGLGVASVSTAKALQLAAQQGIPILDLDQDAAETTVPGLPFDEQVKEEVLEGARRGFVVRIPENAVTHLAWTGVGYRILDPETGEAAYQLQGGHSGGVTAPSYLDWPTVLRDVVEDQGESPAPLETPAERITKLSASDFQEGFVDQNLARPFRAAVTTAGGLRVPAAPVTFTVLGGGGTLENPITKETSTTELTVQADLRGVAEVILRLGQKTSEIPRYLCLENTECKGDENDYYSTQVGLNMVTARAGPAQLAEPFFAYGLPDSRCSDDLAAQGVDLCAYLTIKRIVSGGVTQLRIGGAIYVRMVDRFKNPVSNFGLDFSFLPPPVVGTPPTGWEVARPATETEGHVLRGRDYLRCAEQKSTVRYGECEGETTETRVWTGAGGVSVYAILGDSPYSLYYYGVGTLTGGVYTGFGTHGVICSPTCKGFYTQPIAFTEAVGRGTLVNRKGEVIEAYLPGSTAAVSLTADAVYEGYIIVPSVDSTGTVHYAIKGDNTWTREPLDDAEIVLVSSTPGTDAADNVPAEGNGIYRTQIGIAATPQLNKVEYEARLVPFDIPYLKDNPVEVDPEYVDPGTLQLTQKVKNPDFPHISKVQFNLWGVRPVVTFVDPSPVRLAEGRTLGKSLASHFIEPLNYRSLLQPEWVRFDLRRDGQPILSASGLDPTPFEIPANLPFPPGDYEATLSILGVSRGQKPNLVSESLTVTASPFLELLTPQVVLPVTVDPPTSTSCVTQDRIAFTLGEEARITVLVAAPAGQQVLVAGIDGGAPVPLEDVTVKPGTHEILLPQATLAGFGVTEAPFVLKAQSTKAPVIGLERSGFISSSPDLLTLEGNPRLTIRQIFDSANDSVCTLEPSLPFSVCTAVKLTMLVEGQPLTAFITSESGSPAPASPVVIENLPLSPGRYRISIPADVLGAFNLEASKPYTLTAVSLAEPDKATTKADFIQNDITNRGGLSVGRTFVKGVDLYDGHMVVQETDLSLPGRHLGLELTRTYSSAGKSPEGEMGAGWRWTYGANLLPADTCGLVSLSTADGTGQVFRAVAFNQFVPQKGYHGQLLHPATEVYDYIDKAANRHRFVKGLDPDQPDLFALSYVQEPHGDRIELRRANGRLAEVVEVQDGQDVRKLRLTWEKVGTDRLKAAEAVRADGTPLRLRVDYEYDTWGNLLKATRDGRNAEGLAAEARVHQYAYSTNYQPDRHQLLRVTGPNGDVREYEYFAKNDLFPGDQPGALRIFMEKDEFVRRVTEYPSAAQATVFSYDLQEALINRWKTTVTDPRGIQTFYTLNSNGSPVEIREALGRPEERLTTMKWKAADVLKEEEEDANGRRTLFTYDARGNLTKEAIVTTDFGEVVTEYGYDPTFNKLTSKVDAEGRATTYAIDSTGGDLLEMTDAVGNKTVYAYTPTGLLAQVTDPRGHATLHQDHDDYGNALTVVDPLGNATRRRFDPRGRLAEETDDFGRRRFVEYDGLDQPLVSGRVAGGDTSDEVVIRRYYPGGQVRLEQNAGGALTAFVLDGLNRVAATQTTVEGENLTTTTDYDGNGNKVKEKDRRNVWRNFSYDGLNRLTRVTLPTGPAASPQGEIATYGYDPVGNKLFQTDLAKLRTDFEYDGLYRVSKKLLPEAPTTGPSAGSRYQELYTYDKVGNRLTATDANGNLTTLAYDGLNRLTKTVRDPGGLALETRVTYSDPEGSQVNKAEEHDVQKGLRTLFAYDALNRETLRTVKLEGPDGDAIGPPEYATSTTYDDASHAMTVVDPRGTEIFRRMNGRDLLVEEVVDAGSSGLRLRTTMAYDGLGNRRRVTDPRGNSTLYDFDGLGRLRTMSDALRQDTTYEYDGEGLKTAETDRRGVKRRFTYDNLGRPLRTELLASISAVPWTQEVEYHDQDRKRIETDARGQKITYDLDKLGRVVSITDPDTKPKTLAYDGVNKVAESDKRGHVTRFKYDAVNRLVEVIDPPPFQLQTVTTTYDDVANRVTEKDRRGRLRVTQLDPLGRTRSVTRAGVVLERHEYDGNGNKTRSLDAENRETRFAFDPANRLAARTDGYGTPAAATTTFKYDPSSNPTEERDARATALGEPFSIRRTYDELNRLTSMVDGEAHVTRYSYDPESNKILDTEPKGQKTAYEYDEQGKLTKVIQPEVDVAGGGTSSPVTRHVYDKARNRIRQTDANGHVVEMAYDKLNRLTTMTQDPDGLNLVTEHEYDANGNETKLKDPKGQTVTSTYDELDRLKTKDYAFAPSDPYRPWRHTTGMVHTYDPNSNLVQIDEAVASGTDPPGTPAQILTTLRPHDDLDRLTSETTPLPDGGTKQVGYTYFANGTRQTVTDPESRVTAYAYDGQNRPETATTESGTPDAKVTSYSYEPDDLLKTVTYPNGVVATHAYDLADRLTSLTNAKPGQLPTSAYAYTYDPNGNRTKQVETNGHPAPTTEETTYSYDALNRLASVTYPDKKVGYGYDAVGNRTSEVERNLTDVVLSDKIASFDAVNRLTSITDAVAPTNNASFTWDKNGNQLTKTTGGVTTENRYDVRDQLVEVGQAASILGRFQYDFEGRRTKKIGEGLAGDQIRQYVYDQTSLLAEYNVTGGQVAKYDYGSDRLISLFRSDGEGRRYFHLDGLRSVVNLTDDSGSVAAAYHLSAWGEYRIPTELDASKNRFGFTGHIWDPETNLLFAKARYLDPALGRFISQDSYLGEGQDPPSLHRYFYANANPLRYVDPDGHFALENLIGQRLEKTSINLAGGWSGTSWGSRINFAANAGLQFVARGLQVPTKISEGLANVITPGGADYWSNDHRMAPAGPYRENQRRALDAAASPNISPIQRGLNAASAVLSTPAVLIEETIVAPVMKVPGQAAAVGVHIAQAENTTDPVQKAIHYAEAVKEGSEAFVALGGVAAGAKGLVQGARQGSLTSLNRGRTPDTSGLAARADEVHSVLDPIAQGKRTTSVLGATDASGNPVNVLASGKRDLSPLQRGLVRPGEHLAKDPHAHAEVTAVTKAEELGLNPQGLATTRNICPSCTTFLEGKGATITGPRSATWPSPPAPPISGSIAAPALPVVMRQEDER